jgi:hypothetical protein
LLPQILNNTQTCVAHSAIYEQFVNPDKPELFAG